MCSGTPRPHAWDPSRVRGVRRIRDARKKTSSCGRSSRARQGGANAVSGCSHGVCSPTREWLRRAAIRLSALRGGHVTAVFDADTATGRNTPKMIASRPQLARYGDSLMSHRKLSAPRLSARRIALSTIAATLLSATGFCVDVAVAQQAPKSGTSSTTGQAKPAAPAAKPAAPAPAAPKAGTPAPAAAAPQGAPELPQLVYSPWAKFCGKGQDPNAKEVCFTGKDGRTEAGQPVVAAALIEPAGEPKKLFRITLPSPLQLQFGTRLIVDQDPPISGALFTCFANGCMAD